MTFLVVAVGVFALQCALCYWGQVLAAARGISPWIGFFLALVTPIGLLVLWLSRGSERHRAPASRSPTMSPYSFMVSMTS